MRSDLAALGTLLILAATLSAGCLSPQQDDPSQQEPPPQPDDPNATQPGNWGAGTIAVFTLTGSVEEEGAEYNRTGYCGMSIPSLRLDLEDQRLFYRPSEIDIDRNTTEVLVVDTTGVRWVEPSGCGPFYRVHTFDRSTFTLTWNKTTQAEHWPGTTGNGSASIADTTLRPGGHVNLTLNQTLPAPHEGQGLYHYNGTLTLTLQGWWTRNQIVSCDNLGFRSDPVPPECR